MTKNNIELTYDELKEILERKKINQRKANNNYYLKNKDLINEKRVQKYSNDEEKRKKINERARDYYHKNKDIRKERQKLIVSELNIIV
jgi:hypothetical protein